MVDFEAFSKAMAGLLLMKGEKPDTGQFKTYFNLIRDEFRSNEEFSSICVQYAKNNIFFPAPSELIGLIRSNIQLPDIGEMRIAIELEEHGDQAHRNVGLAFNQYTGGAFLAKPKGDLTIEAQKWNDINLEKQYIAFQKDFLAGNVQKMNFERLGSAEKTGPKRLADLFVNKNPVAIEDRKEV